MYWIGFHAVLFWFLFADFYKNAYRKNMAASKKKREDGISTKECSQSLPVKNGYTNGHCPGVNAYTNGFSDKDVLLNGNGCAHNGIASELNIHSNGHQCQNQYGDSIKKIN